MRRAGPAGSALLLALLLGGAPVALGSTGAAAPTTGPASAPDTRTLVPVAQLGAGAGRLTTLGTDAFVASGRVVVVVDTAQAAHPAERARTAPFDAVVVDLAAADGVLYVLTADGRLHAMDAAQPRRRLTTSKPGLFGAPRRVVVRGRLGAVLGAHDVVLVDLAPGGGLARLGQIVLTGAVESAILTDDYLYIAGENRLATVDVRVPARPARVDEQLLTEVVAAGLGSSLYLADGQLYATLGQPADDTLQRPDLWIFTLADPARPALRHTVALDDWRSVAVVAAGGFAHLLGEAAPYDGSLALRSVDLADPVRPQTSGTLALGRPRLGLSELGLALQEPGEGQALRLAATNGRDLVLAAPAPADAVELGRAAVGGWSITDVALHGPRALVADGGAGLRVLDLSDPAEPSMATVPSTGWGPFAVAPAPLGAAGSGAVAWTSMGDEALAVDVTDLAHPGVVGRLPLDRIWSDIAVDRDGTVLGIDGDGWLTLVDGRAPASPRRLGQIRAMVGPDAGPAACRDPWLGLDGSLALVRCRAERGGIVAVDVSDRATPRLLGTLAFDDVPFTWPSIGPGLMLLPTKEYLGPAQPLSGLRVIDLAGGPAAREIALYPLCASATTLFGPTALVRGCGEELHLLDLRHPAEPRVMANIVLDIGSAPYKGAGPRLALNERLALVAEPDGYRGLVVLERRGRLFLPSLRR
jgi:hypothetical protein